MFYFIKCCYSNIHTFIQKICLKENLLKVFKEISLCLGSCWRPGQQCRNYESPQGLVAWRSWNSSGNLFTIKVNKFLMNFNFMRYVRAGMDCFRLKNGSFNDSKITKPFLNTFFYLLLFIIFFLFLVCWIIILNQFLFTIRSSFIIRANYKLGYRICLISQIF